MYSYQKPVTYTEAQKKLERYCVYQDRCHIEVERKLSELRLIPEAREKIIIHLIDQNYLDETRFSCSFVRGKFRNKKWGKHRILQELKQRKISAYNIKKGLKEIGEGEYLETFHELANKRWGQVKNEPISKARQKFVSYMQYRGWETEYIFSKLNELTNS